MLPDDRVEVAEELQSQAEATKRKDPEADESGLRCRRWRSARHFARNAQSNGPASQPALRIFGAFASQRAVRCVVVTGGKLHHHFALVKDAFVLFLTSLPRKLERPGVAHAELAL